MAKKKKSVKPKDKGDDLYVKMDPADAIEAKKDFLEVTASLIKLQMLGGKLKDMGKSEVKDTGKIKRELKSINILLGKVMEDMPKVKLPREHIEHPKKELPQIEAYQPGTKTKKAQPNKKTTLNQELLAIKQKLAKFS
ncbi:hypothetical protein ACFLZZ_02645 [Nanoarchaeota archaeon]